MAGFPARAARLESLVADLLQNGSRLASAMIAVGWCAAMIKAPMHPAEPLFPVALRLIRCGVGLFILLPVLRVVLMVVMFARDKNYRLATVAIAVLTVILIGCLVGIRAVSALPG